MADLFRKKALTLYPSVVEQIQCGGGPSPILRKISKLKTSEKGYSPSMWEKDKCIKFVDSLVVDEDGRLNDDAMQKISDLQNIFLVTEDKKNAQKTANLLCALHRISRDDFDECDADDGYEELEDDNPSAPMVTFHLDKEKDDKDVQLPVRIIASMTGMEYAFFDGLNDASSFEEGLELVMVCPAKLRVICIPPALKNNPSIQNLVRLDPEKNRMLMPGATEFEYYIRVCRYLLESEDVSVEDDDELRKAVLKMKRHVGEGFNEEWIGYFLDKGFDGGHVDFLKMFEDYGEGENESSMDKVMRMTGLAGFKTMIRENSALVHEESINPGLKQHKNMIFAGNPGTGKTTAANLTAQVFADTGVTDPVFFSPSRSDLVGKYVGQTAPKIKDAFEKARGGVLFIDEAGFFLNRGSGGFVDEAIREFVRYMEMYPDVTVVFAMYSSEVADFLKLDDGLSSRISRIVKFDDYSVPELLDITESMLKDNGYTLKGGRRILEDYFVAETCKENFGNARAARKVAESIILSKSMSRKKDDPDRDMFITDRIVKNAVSRLENSEWTEKKTGNIGFAPVISKAGTAHTNTDLKVAYTG